MRIGVIGAGNVGGTLGRRWAGAGHDVTFGIRGSLGRDLRKILEASQGRARAATVAEAVRDAEVVVLAVPWAAVPEVIQSAGELTGKVVVDCTNPLQPKMAGVEVPPAGSAGEQVAQWARGARVVKAFNTTGAENMADPRYADGAASMLVAADDKKAKATVMGLASDLGFEPVDAGPLRQARLLEQFALLWISLAVGGQGRGIAFRLMRR